MDKRIPDYLKIYRDMICMKYPEKAIYCSPFFQKNTIDRLDIIRLDAIITGSSDKQKIRENQKLKSYDRKTILQILNHQKKHNMNNTQVARHFELSINTVTKWKKIFFPNEWQQ